MTRALKAGLLTVSVAAFVMAFVGNGAAQVRGAAHAAPGHTGGVRVMQRLVATPLQPNFAPVPGLGFNFQALGATALASRPNRLRRGQVITPILWYYPYSPYVDYAYDPPQPPYDDQQPLQATAQPVQYAPSDRPAESLDLEPPPAEVSQFILVRLDGQVVFAVAFTAVDGRLTYVTREGLRRSFPVSEVDKQATLQMNDANGTSISLPE